MFDFLRRWREDYYASRVLSSVARPIQRAGSTIARSLRAHVPRNGAEFRLPNGQIMRIGRDSGIYLASALFWDGIDSFEPATSKTLQYFFSRAATFVDVGANYGFYSLLGAHWNPKMRVVAFEPVPQIFESLQRNIKLNQLESRVDAHCVALSESNGQATLYFPSGGSRDFESTASLAKGSWQERKAKTTIEVRTARFDDFERQHPCKLDVVKIDVEDHEASVLRGMQGVIRRDRPFIVCEILPRPHHNEKTREMIDLLGYTPYWITPLGCIRVSRFDFDRQESEDFLLSPVSSDIEILTDLEALWTKREQKAVA